jgi:hypothetical protein
MRSKALHGAHLNWDFGPKFPPLGKLNGAFPFLGRLGFLNLPRTAAGADKIGKGFIQS